MPTGLSKRGVHLKDLAKWIFGIAVAAGCVGVIAYAARASSLRHSSNSNPATEIRSVSWLSANYRVKDMKPAVGAYVLRGAPTTEKVVALTFDDGPRSETTDTLIKVLEREHVPATFFLIGNRVETYPDLVLHIEANGFEIGNHSYSHINLKSVPFEEVETEYETTNEAIREIVGHAPRYCRPPGGANNFDVERAAATVGLQTVLWSDDPADYRKPGEQAIYDSTLEHLTPGGIILLHDGVTQTLNVLPRLIHEIWKRGYRIVPLSQLKAGKV